MKRYQTTIIIEIPDSKIEEMREEYELDKNEDMDDYCYDLAQEIANDMTEVGEDYDCSTTFGNNILYVEEIK